MSWKNELEELGVNVEEGLDRVMGDESLYTMMLGLFVDEVKGSPISPEEFDTDNYEDLTKRVHALKGTTGNLSIVPLFEGYTEALGLLRNDKPKEAKAVFERLLPIQSKIVACIEQQ